MTETKPSSVHDRAFPVRTSDEVSALVQDALVHLDGTIVAAQAVVQLCLSENSSMAWKTVMQRYNALDVLMQNAAKAGDQVWAAIDCEVKSSDEQ
ncbi:MAG TPA: hypothetical protein PKV67_05780 [Hyphomonas sp.]|nr:MAG: hypothetical protein VR75_09925 [Hyphomonadaceae bacterium BRH_c29]HAY07623.1 hypothetical protein [Hyphomonas sp.]HRJ00266.1 hypothetical protein [Hyphomonas sp.]HRK69393.1 hypothetical protein [Hyphomonas sp.]